jgi:hypothetical protein
MPIAAKTDFFGAVVDENYCIAELLRALTDAVVSRSM